MNLILDENLVTKEDIVSRVTDVMVRVNEQTKLKQLELKEPWYDFECNNLRTKSFNLLKQYRRNYDPVVKIKYVSVNRQYIDLCRKKKSSYFKCLSNKINNVTNTKEWWSLVKKLQV